MADIRVNTTTLNNQQLPAVAMDASGDFVVAWQSAGQDGDGDGVFARRYNEAGVVQGGEFRVNTYTSGDQRNAAVAMDADGDFVVAWQSAGQDSDGFGIHAQRYNAAGEAQGSEFQVNTFTSGFQISPSVAMDANGDFVVVWQSAGQDGDGYGIYAQRYNAAGEAQGNEFLVNTFETGYQGNPTVAMDADGDFVVAWESSSTGSSYYGIHAQLFNAVGEAQTGEFLVNTYTFGFQINPTVAMDAAGDFVVAWQSFGPDGSNDDIYAQRYNASGVAQGGEFRVNTYTSTIQNNPTVAMDADGDFTVAWQSDSQDGSGYGIYAQRYNAAGVAQGGEFRLNTTTSGDQKNPAVASPANGDALVVWQSTDGNGAGIYICFYPGTMIATPMGERAVETLAIGDLVLTAEGEARPVRWMGRQTVSTRFADPLRVLPIRIRAGALARNVPSRDLLVSPDHALLVQGLLVQAGALVNGSTITREARVPERFTYHHVELADHSLILAENTPAETFVDNVDRMAFDNWDEHEALYGHLPSIPEMARPRAKSHRQVPPTLRKWLVARARQAA